MRRNYRLIFCYETHIWFLNISQNEEIAILNSTSPEKEENKEYKKLNPPFCRHFYLLIKSIYVEKCIKVPIRMGY